MDKRLFNYSDGYPQQQPKPQTDNYNVPRWSSHGEQPKNEGDLFTLGANSPFSSRMASSSSSKKNEASDKASYFRDNVQDSSDREEFDPNMYYYHRSDSKEFERPSHPRSSPGLSPAFAPTTHAVNIPNYSLQHQGPQTSSMPMGHLGLHSRMPNGRQPNGMHPIGGPRRSPPMGPLHPPTRSPASGPAQTPANPGIRVLGHPSAAGKVPSFHTNGLNANRPDGAEMLSMLGNGHSNPVSHHGSFPASSSASAASSVAGDNHSEGDSAALDPSEFPALASRSSRQGSLATSTTSSLDLRELEALTANEFRIQKEDFPALPGAPQPSTSTAAPTTADPGEVNSMGLLMDRFGMYGLLGVIGMTHQDLNTLALGMDLTGLGLNLNASEPLHTTFSSPFADATLAQPQYSLPPCYVTSPRAITVQHFGRFSVETLLYIFYELHREQWLRLAAHELMAREWRYLKDCGVWYTRATPPSDFQYVYFDHKAWERRALLDPAVLQLIPPDDSGARSS